MKKNEIIEWESTYQKISQILIEARQKAWRAVNSSMVIAYWEIGKVIVEKEQEGKERAQYGETLLRNLSEKLIQEFGKGFGITNLKYIRLFFRTYPIGHALRDQLSWTHYRLLLKIEKQEARSFYENETINSRWSTRELERQMSSLLFERLALSRDKKGLLELAQKGQEVQTTTDLVKDPYVLEFTGIPESTKLLESTLEQALLTRMKEFLLELGKGFSFVGRQQRITLDGEHFYIDLVFYNRFTKSFVLIDLKSGKLTHQDIGQMQMYVNYYTRVITTKEENPPIGIILCAEKNHAVVKFTLPEDNKQIFISKYKLYLPTEEELIQELEKERKILEPLIKEKHKEDKKL